ncbi:hypothetical protein [Streptomyces wuyuanensis]|uniref:hypothetical protein n=1 Tax=Streptomyces wuyuanensis TaxID=1196353 RepID=UPI003D71FA1F
MTALAPADRPDPLAAEPLVRTEIKIGYVLPDPGRSITSIATLPGVSPGTLSHHIPDVQELRASAVPAGSKPGAEPSSDLETGTPVPVYRRRRPHRSGT